MTANIIIGNIISFIAALFMVASCWVNDKKKAYFCQTANCAIACVAAVFFQSWSGLTTLIISTIRNYLVMKEKYTKGLMKLFTPLVLVIGLAVNNRGIPGLLPPLATVQLSLCNYYVKSLMGAKLSFLVNNLMWATYGFCIMDLSAGMLDGATCVIGLISIVRLFREEKRERELEARQEAA